MATITLTADPQGRINLPASFANKTIVMQEMSDTEIRIRTAETVPEEEVVFSEEIPIILSQRDRERFFAALENPPPANEALRKLLAKYPAHG